MAGTDQPQSDRTGDEYQRGPNPSPGGEVDTTGSAVPPYDDRNEGRNARSEGPERALSGQDAPQEPTQPEGSAPDRGPEMAPEGVGESINRRGEDVVKQEGKEAGRSEEGTQGESDRSKGSADNRDISGV